MHGHHDEAGSRQEKATRKKEVTALFTNLSDDEANDITELSCVLTNPVIVICILTKLEAAVAEKTQEKLKIANEKMTPKDRKYGELEEDEFLDPNEKHARRKILSDVLYQWAIDNKMVNVTEEGHGEFLRFNRLLADDKAFLSHINQGKFFKDRGTPTASHGVWTHFIQWYILVEYFKSLKNKSPLHQPILALYKLLGDEEKGRCSKKSTSLWVWLCDDNATSKPQHDFRSPDRLHAFMKDSKDKFRYLSQFVQYDENLKAVTNPSTPHTTTSTYDPVTGKKTPWK